MGDNLKKYQRAIHCTSGVILIAGPTGSGKSSTMNTMISQLNTEEVNVVTLEDPVEYNIDGVNQVQINEKTGMDFANGLRATSSGPGHHWPSERSETVRPPRSVCVPQSPDTLCFPQSIPTMLWERSNVWRISALSRT